MLAGHVCSVPAGHRHRASSKQHKTRAPNYCTRERAGRERGYLALHDREAVVRQAGVQPNADGRLALCVEAEQLLVAVLHSIRRQRPLAVAVEWDGPRVHLRPYLEAAACTAFMSSFGARRGRHSWRSTRSSRGKLAGRITTGHFRLGRFCDQFLNALDRLYKGRIIAQT